MNVNYLNKELNYELSLSAYWWSFDGQFLLYASFNDSLVNKNTINLYTDSTDYLTSNLHNEQQITYPLVSFFYRLDFFQIFLEYNPFDIKLSECSKSIRMF